MPMAKIPKLAMIWVTQWNSGPQSQMHDFLDSPLTRSIQHFTPPHEFTSSGFHSLGYFYTFFHSTLKTNFERSFFPPHETVIQTQQKMGADLTQNISNLLWLILLAVCTDKAITCKYTHELMISVYVSFFLLLIRLELSVRHEPTSCVLILV